MDRGKERTRRTASKDHVCVSNLIGHHPTIELIIVAWKTIAILHTPLRDTTDLKHLERLWGPLHIVKLRSSVQVKNIKTEGLYGKKNGLIERYIKYV